ncbi:MAG: pentapeptide repeat-containing protein [Cyanobacteria bacterium P01_F01_bin.150]
MKILLDTKIFVDLCLPSSEEHSVTHFLWQSILAYKQTDTEFWMMQESLNASLVYLAGKNEGDELELVEKYLGDINSTSLSPQEIYQLNRNIYQTIGKQNSRIPWHIYLFHKDDFDLILTSRKDDYSPFLDLDIFNSSNPTILFTLNEYLGHLKVVNSRVNELQDRFIINESLFNQEKISDSKAIKQNISYARSREIIDSHYFLESPPNLEDFLIRCRGGGKLFSKLSLNSVYLEKENLRDICIEDSEFYNSEFILVNLSYSLLKRNDFNRCNMRFSDLREAWIEDTDFSRANLSGCNLRKATLRNVDLSRSNLQDADLSGVDCRNTNFSYANLDRADFTDANLEGANFKCASIKNADFKNSSIFSSNYCQANLNYSKLDYSIIERSDFDEAELMNSDFSYSELLHSSFYQSILFNSNFHRTLMRGTCFNKDALLSANNILRFFKDPKQIEEILEYNLIYELDEDCYMVQEDISETEDIERIEANAICEQLEKERIEMMSLEYQQFLPDITSI